MPKEEKQKIIEHMFKSACGYGMADKKNGSGKKSFEKCMNSIPEELFEEFVYTLYRIADKSGADGFDF